MRNRRTNSKRARSSRASRWLGVLTLLILTVSLRADIATAPAATAPAVQVLERSGAPTVGTEGRVDLVVPFDDLVPVVAGSKADVVVRVAERRQWGTGWRYDLRWVAAVPGRHDLAKYLRRDGQPDAPLVIEAVMVEATSVLPQAYDGKLGDVGSSAVGGVRWYWPVAILVALAWLAMLVPFIRHRLQRRTGIVSAAPAKPLTLGERLRPLVAAAAKGELDADGQGLLERLLLHVWRRRLKLEGLPAAHALAQMKAHPEAGQILRAMEDWLHRPPGSVHISDADLTKLLKPYADLPGDSAEAQSGVSALEVA